MGNVRYDFGDETVVVTGGSSGIGRAIALAFAAGGGTVVNGDIDPEPKDVDAEVPTHERITEDGGTAAFVETDVSDPDAVADLVARAREFGGVDVMVNNAGIFLDGSIRETTPEELQRLFEVNISGVFFGMQAAANDMIDRGLTGTIVNTASISSEIAQYDHAQYDMTKGAIKMLTRTGALELSEYDIRVNAVAPGHIATEIIEGMTENVQGTDFQDDIIKPVPLGRPGYPEDVADVAVFLASEGAGYVTGEAVFVDGGLHIY